MMQSDKAVVPTDVYYNILHRIKDLTFLWTTCRAVSRDFRDAVDLVFIRHHLPRTYLTANMGSRYSEADGRSASFDFDSLDPTDPSIALFKDKECRADYRPKLITRLKNHFDQHGNPCHAPRIIIQLRRLANDTPICDMKPDWNNLSLTANWKKMFSEFFAEEKAYSRSMRAQLEAAQPAIAAMRDEDLETAMNYVFETYDKHVKIARRQVRERRIKRHVWEERHIDWTQTDSKGLKNVTDAREALGWIPGFSDDEEEPEEDERDEEEEEDVDEEVDDEEDEETDEEEEVSDDEEASESDEDSDDFEGSGRRTKRRTEGVSTRPRRSKTPASTLPPDQSTGPSPAPTGFAFTFKAPPPSSEIMPSSRD